MGYTTEFEGRFELDRSLTQEHIDYLEQFSNTRRMLRDPKIVEGMPDPVREDVGLGPGEDGEYFVGGKGMCGQDCDKSVIDQNSPPANQPGLWCQWVPTKCGRGIEWDQGEKFYNYFEWLEYIVSNFLKPWGYVLNGKVKWRGEEFDDIGTIVVEDNLVVTYDHFI